MKKIKIGKRIVEARLKKQMQQKDFAKATGIAAANLSDYERDITLPSIQSIAKIAATLDVTIDYLVFGKLNKNAEKELIDRDLLNGFKNISELPAKDKKMIAHVMNTLLLGCKIQNVTK